MKRNPKYKKLAVELPHRALVIYAGQRVRNALHEITAQMDLCLATRLQLVMQAVYEQGLKDGRKELIERMDQGIRQNKGRDKLSSARQAEKVSYSYRGEP